VWGLCALDVKLRCIPTTGCRAHLVGLALLKEVEDQAPEVRAGLQLLKDPDQGCSLLLKAQLAPEAIQQQGVVIGIDRRGRPWWSGGGVVLGEE
jgi:hypothetical protein